MKLRLIIDTHDLLEQPHLSGDRMHRRQLRSLEDIYPTKMNPDSQAIATGSPHCA